MNKSLQEIIDYLISNFKRKFKNKLHQIAVQLYYVSCGIKSGFLWDFGGAVDIEWIESLLKSMKKTNLVRIDLIARQINEEIFIINSEFLKVRDIPVFIDVTKNLENPKIINKSTNTSIEIMLKWIESNVAKNMTAVKIPDEICLTSLIGYLIGYPVVYWLDTQLSDDNCLGNVTIKVFQSIHEGNVILSSFSVPEMLVDNYEIQWAVKLWNDRQVSNSLSVTTFNTNENMLIM